MTNFITKTDESIQYVKKDGTPKFWKEYSISTEAMNVIGTAATYTNPSASTLGGFNLDAEAEQIAFHAHVDADWIGDSDLTVEVFFEVNVDNTEGAAEDDTIFDATVYYKGNAESAQKTQATTGTVVVGQSAQYKQFKAELTIDYDAVDNVVEAGDTITFILNLDVTNSDIDNVIVNYVKLRYKKKILNIEA